MNEAKSLFDSCIQLRDSEAELYFFRGLLSYLLEKPVEAIPDIELAIDKAEDNMPSHYMARGLCYAYLKLYKDAL